jgi:hypothetical protein
MAVNSISERPSLRRGDDCTMSEVPINRLDFQDDRKLISPPIVVAPLYQCATVVTIIGYLPGALLDVQVDGVTVITGAPGGFPMPNGATLPLPAALVAAQRVRARQQTSFAISDWSPEVVVGDHTKDYPTGLPRPEINPAPVYHCGSRTGVSNLLIGCNVWIHADGIEVGRQNGAAAHQGVNVNPDYGANQDVRAFAELCADPSPPSLLHKTQEPPSPLPSALVETVYDGGSQITITGLVNGARFHVIRNGIDLGTWRTWGQRHLVGLNPALAAGETLEVIQGMCPGDPTSPPIKTVVQPCSALPAPTVAPIQDGATSVTLLQFVPDAIIKVYVNLVKRGESGGPIVQLTSPVQHGDIVHVRQIVGDCIGQSAQEIKSRCVAPPITGDPSALNLYPIGDTEYHGGTITSLGATLSVRGSVYYPADDDGLDQPFNSRVKKHGPIPIVFMAHGNHSAADPSYLGYDYFQQQLAKMGIIAVSVDCNETNGPGGGVGNIHQRADLIIAAIAHFQTLNAGDPIFTNSIDFTKVGLMGHSRGGDAVVRVPETIALAGVQIQALIALDPTEFGAHSGKPQGYTFMTILPAANGDVRRNDGAKYYDRAEPARYKSQVYVHYANHNFFNRQWLNDDTGGGLPLMPRGDHERVLSAYGCALYRNVLLGHATDSYLFMRALPAGVQTHNVHLSFEIPETFTVDHHQDGNGIGTNSLNQPTAQAGGLVADEFLFHQGAGAFNSSFFGDTVGMVADAERDGTFRSALDKPLDIVRREIWLRAAEVFEEKLPPDATGFEVGIEDLAGVVRWVDIDECGGLPRPFDRTSFDSLTKTMLKTFRIPGRCFAGVRRKLDIQAVLLRLNRGDGRAIAFDVLQII